MNVAELLDSLASPWTFLLVLIVYGFAPGFLLRLLVLLYHPEDERRDELVAELYDVPRLKRPFWVAEQFETVLFDGLVPRVRWALTGRLILRWKLRSGVKQNRLHPTTFWIPSEEEKDQIEPGDVVKLMFQQSDGWGERMWVIVEKMGRRRITGTLTNTPLGFPRLDAGHTIRFRREHIIDIDTDPHQQSVERQHSTMCEGCRDRNESDAIPGREADNGWAADA